MYVFGTRGNNRFYSTAAPNLVFRRYDLAACHVPGPKTGKEDDASRYVLQLITRQ